MKIGKVLAVLAVGALVGAVAYVGVGAANGDIDLAKVSNNTQLSGKPTNKDVVKFKLAPSNDQLAQCMPHVKVDISVALKTDATGRDIFKVDVSGAPAKTSFTIFLLEVPASPFGAAEYIGDVNTDKYGRGHVELRLIVEEAFSSTLVGKERVRKELNHVGMWFADPKDDDFCLGDGKGPITPFDGDDEAGIQAFNSAKLKYAPIP
jgi:hypothetical protein